MGLFKKKEKIVYGCNLTVNGNRIDNSLSRKLRGVPDSGAAKADPSVVEGEETFVAGYDGVQSPGHFGGNSSGFAGGLDPVGGSDAPQWATFPGMEPSPGLYDTPPSVIRNDMPLGVPFEQAVAEELENTFRGYGGDIIVGPTLPAECGLFDEDGNPVRLDIVAVFPTGIVVIGCVDWDGSIDCCGDIDVEWSMRSPYGDVLGYFNPVQSNDDNILALCEYLGISDSYVSSAVVFSDKSVLQNLPAPVEHYCIGMFTDLQKFLIDIMCEDGQQLPRIDQIKMKLRGLQ